MDIKKPKQYYMEGENKRIFYINIESISDDDVQTYIERITELFNMGIPQQYLGNDGV